MISGGEIMVMCVMMGNGRRAILVIENERRAILLVIEKGRRAILVIEKGRRAILVIENGRIATPLLNTRMKRMINQHTPLHIPHFR